MRTLRRLIALGFITMMGTVSSCSTMGGGGGMRYFTDASPATPQAESM